MYHSNTPSVSCHTDTVQYCVGNRNLSWSNTCIYWQYFNVFLIPQYYGDSHGDGSPYNFPNGAAFHGRNRENDNDNFYRQHDNVRQSDIGIPSTHNRWRHSPRRGSYDQAYQPSYNSDRSIRRTDREHSHNSKKKRHHKHKKRHQYKRKSADSESVSSSSGKEHTPNKKSRISNTAYAFAQTGASHQSNENISPNHFPTAALGTTALEEFRYDHCVGQSHSNAGAPIDCYAGGTFEIGINNDDSTIGDNDEAVASSILSLKSSCRGL